jgi:hypothetical protein
MSAGSYAVFGGLGESGGASIATALSCKIGNKMSTVEPGYNVMEGTKYFVSL